MTRSSFLKRATTAVLTLPVLNLFAETKPLVPRETNTSHAQKVSFRIYQSVVGVKEGPLPKGLVPMSFPLQGDTAEAMMANAEVNTAFIIATMEQQAGLIPDTVEALGARTKALCKQT